MSTLTITAVDATANTLSITAHGLTTGDGPVAVFSPLGSVAGVPNAMPGGLAGATSYWVYRVDASTLKVATSNANALAGTTIDITSVGAGPLFLLRSLPFRVPRTAMPGVQVFSADSNDSWSSDVLLWNLLTGQTPNLLAPGGVTLTDCVTLNGVSLEALRLYESTAFEHGHHASAWKNPTGGAGSYTGPTWTFSGAADIYSPLDYLRPGDKITTIDWVYNRGGAGTVNAHLFRRTHMGVEAPVQTDADTTGTVLTENSYTYNHTIAAGYAYFLRWGCGSSSSSFHSAHVHVSRPRP